jgi:Transmembrane family 220, helix
MVWAKRTLHFVLALMFLAFAVLQINDPDPIVWILIYVAMVVICACAAFDKYFPKVMLVLFAGYLIYMIILFPGVAEWYQSPDRSLLFDDLAKMEYPYIEESREFLGLLICQFVLAIYLIISRTGVRK